MSNITETTVTAILNRENLDRLVNGDKQVFRIPDRTLDESKFFSITLDKDSCPEAVKSLPDDLTMTIAKHSESCSDTKLDEYSVQFRFTRWKERIDVSLLDGLKDYSDMIAEYVIDMEQQGKHILDFPSAPYFYWGTTYVDGVETIYESNEEVRANSSWYETVHKAGKDGLKFS